MGADPVLRLGLIGCGRLAERAYLDAVGRAQSVELAGLADTTPERCERLAASIPAYRTAAELISAERINLVVVATPVSGHLAGARAASQAGLASLVEKPPAPSLAEAVELAALHPQPAMGFNRRFEPGMTALRRRVTGADRLDLRLRLHHPAGSWLPYEARDDALMALGPHLIDLALWLSASEATSVRASRLTPERVQLESDD